MRPVLQPNSLNEIGYNAYIEYLALKRHFTSSYNYHKYNGKVNASYDSFLSRKDAFSFQKLGKQRDYQNIILSNMVKNPKIWVGALFEQDARDTYLKWKQIQASITHHVEDSLSVLDDDFQENFIVRDGQYPHIVDLFLQKRISLEVFCILVKISNSEPYWKQKVVDKVIFPDIMNIVEKYYPFLDFSSEKMKKVIKNHFF